MTAKVSPLRRIRRCALLLAALPLPAFAVMPVAAHAVTPDSMPALKRSDILAAAEKIAQTQYDALRQAPDRAGAEPKPALPSSIDAASAKFFRAESATNP